VTAAIVPVPSAKVDPNLQASAFANFGTKDAPLLWKDSHLVDQRLVRRFCRDAPYPPSRIRCGVKKCFRLSARRGTCAWQKFLDRGVATALQTQHRGAALVFPWLF